ncbi:MAG: hypothetical protein ABI076_01600 [Acidobacteriaceae bacterium]
MPETPICPKCGKPAGLVLSRVVRHRRTLGILWVTFAAYLALTWMMVLPFLHMATHSNTPWMHGSGGWMHGSDMWMYGSFHPGGWLMHWITAALVVRALLSLAVGIALLTRQPWGRIFAIVIAVLTLLKPLLGTVLAIYTLWVLLEWGAGQNYQHIVLRRNMPAGNMKSGLHR